MKLKMRSGRILFAAMLASFAAACSAVTGGNEFGPIVIEGQSARAEVAGSIGDVSARTLYVLSTMSLELADGSDEDNATEREYEARNGDRVVHVKLEQRPQSLVTILTVSSRLGSTNYEADHARTIIQQVQALPAR